MHRSYPVGGSTQGEAENQEEYLPKPKDKLTQFRKDISWSTNSAFALIFNTCYDLEKHAIDALRSKLVRPVYPLVISIPSIIVSETSNEDYYFKWLDSKPRSSVLYISLGSFLSVSGSQMDALACGIREAGVRFLWIVREEAQSQRIAELAGDRGLVLQWCNQVGVLRHASVGGFLTHCGWNSALEGAFDGVPMLTFPIFWDQFPNSKIVVDDWKVGMRLKKIDASGVSEDEISRVVAEFMDLNAENSKEMRRRAAELKEKCRGSVDHGGSSSINLEAFVHDLLQLKE